MNTTGIEDHVEDHVEGDGRAVHEVGPARRTLPDRPATSRAERAEQAAAEGVPRFATGWIHWSGCVAPTRRNPWAAGPERPWAPVVRVPPPALPRAAGAGRRHRRGRRGAAAAGAGAAARRALPPPPPTLPRLRWPHPLPAAAGAAADSVAPSPLRNRDSNSSPKSTSVCNSRARSISTLSGSTLLGSVTQQSTGQTAAQAS